MAEHEKRISGFMAGSKPKGVTSSDFDFNLQQTKSRVLKALDERVPNNFRKFFASSQYDRLLQTLLLYFTAMFQLDWVVKSMDKARKTHLEGYNPYAVAARMHELEDELKALRMEISPLYSTLILKFSNYTKPQQDMMFFETLYETLISILDEAFLKLTKRPEIEQEMGALFRSRHFNLYQRKNKPTRSVDTLGVKELYALKNETSNRALNSKMLASLFEKPPTIGVTVASVTNSPLISQFISSPIVARSLMKDPEARQNLMRSMEVESRPATEAPRRDIKSIFKSTAMLHGVNVKALQENVSDMSMPADAQAAAGVLQADRAYRSDRNKAPTGMIAPEAAGLPVDDAYNHLALLKRYVIYGPGMGMNTKEAMQLTSAGQGGALSSMSSMIPPQSPASTSGLGTAGSMGAVAHLMSRASVKQDS